MKEKYLKQTVSDFIEERLQDSHKQLIHNEGTKEVMLKYNSLFEKLKNTIPNVKLLEKYREVEFDLYTMQLIQAYKIGFKDCIIIFRD